MTSAAHIGRVGALAVALGIGSAVFAGQAWADDTSSSSAGSSATSNASSASAGEKSATSAGPVRTTPTRTDRAERPRRFGKPDKSDKSDKPDKSDTADGTEKPTAKPTSKRPSWKKPDTKPAPTSDGKPDRTSETADSARDSAETTPAPSVKALRAEVVSPDPAAPPRSSTLALLRPASETATHTRQVERPVVKAVVEVARSMVDWAHQKADAGQGQTAPPPFLWALLSVARRELESLSAGRTTRVASANLTSATPVAAAAVTPVVAAAVTPYSPWLNPQVSPSTNFVSWVTGGYSYGDPLKANTVDRFSVWGTDVGTMWDNGMVDNPATPNYNEHQVLIAVGDTFSGPNMTGRHIFNTLFRSSDTDLSDGITIPNGEWFTGNYFGGAPLDGPVNARPIINPQKWLPSSVTMIPTAGVSVNVPVTKDTPFGTIQYVSYMSVSKWGSAGKWTTNYSAIGYSTDNGENFTIDPNSIRYNSFLSGNKNFQQSAFVKGDDGYIYVYGTPNGRQGAAYLSRVAPENILDPSKYEYYKAASKSWLGSSPAGWVKGNPSAATAIIGKSGGFLGFTKPGYTVSEMSVQYNEYLGKYIVLYGDQNNNIVMRTADTPEGVWSDATVLMTQQPGGIYAPMLHPWSPSTLGTGSDLYFNLSLWSSYNVMLMHTDLSKV
ncbi:DUF4185 domain-containing protein [Mycolicibacterium obuense]|uniref:DUF4185 domain-containing protein n=1 Tax=Mycolicibacterium obuense TaxID=1807 RepID=A0A0M2K0H6_9MYCO|nr:DUF4185 domain-containing protein [Mycolicibacterium obuense]KKF02862.1 hypothetical protein WN67_06445 [Mycolicibacterium obuense]